MKYLLLVLSLFLGSVGYAQQLFSPNKKIKVVVEMRTAGRKGLGQAYFKVLYKNKDTYVEVLPGSPLGILRADQQFISNLKLVSESKPVNQLWIKASCYNCKKSFFRPVVPEQAGYIRSICFL